ncbi:hypothetical protein [Streptomyces sp. YGL11-2]|uniref:hypothetical protein n=1 Tax=Streptomyces sp. YGL11-2 TaxID=3414028 RepID=UPI003CF471EE
MVTTAPYGSWASPLDARTVAARDGRPAWVDFVGDDVWWTEPRPAEDGRRALTVPLGVPAELDASAGTLTCAIPALV